MSDLSDRNIRHRDLIPEAELDKLTVLVIGTGAIGRQAVMQLAAIGVPRIMMIDLQNVEVENLAAQGFFEEGNERNHASIVRKMRVACLLRKLLIFDSTPLVFGPKTQFLKIYII